MTRFSFRAVLAAALFLGVGGFKKGSPPPALLLSSVAACDGVTDDSLAVQSAFNAAANAARTLVVDCPAFLHQYQDVTRPIFVDNFTTVNFTSNGLFIMDNSWIPGFVIVDSSTIVFNNVKIRYQTTANLVTPANQSIALDWDSAGCYSNGAFLAGCHAGAQFNDAQLTPWMAAHRNINFSGANAGWPGPTSISALFEISGFSTNIKFNNLNVFVPASAGGSACIPVVMSFQYNWLPNTTITGSTPKTLEFAGLPSDITVNGAALDGCYMGFAGQVNALTLQNVQAYRYADQQDTTTAIFQGSVSGNILTAQNFTSTYGVITPGQTLYDSTGALPQGTFNSSTAQFSGNLTIVSQIDGPIAGVSHYLLSGTATVAAETMTAANYQTIGGAGCGDDAKVCTFAPPHLVYVSTAGSGILDVTSNTTVSNVVDHGIRFGSASRNPNSGDMRSLKFGGTNMAASNYTTFRPDGIADLPQRDDGLTVSGLSGTYNSSISYNRYPGIRFPGNAGYTNVSVSATISDLAAITLINPINAISTPNNFSLIVDSTMRAWGGGGALPAQPGLIGTVLGANTVNVTYHIVP